jgi:RNA polymerase sigma-70 factor (ECF subfamily)
VTLSPTRQLAAEAQSLDAALMERVRRRDPAALQELYDRHAGVVHGIGLRVLRDATDAQDLVQDVFLHLWRRSELFDAERGVFLGWLVSLARNRAIDRVRARRTRERSADSLELERASDVAPRAADPNESAYAAELRLAVARALAVLPDAQRTALELAYFGGLSHSEISERLETPLGTIKARIRQGMIRLRDTLGDFADAATISAPGEERT